MPLAAAGFLPVGLHKCLDEAPEDKSKVQTEKRPKADKSQTEKRPKVDKSHDAWA